MRAPPGGRGEVALRPAGLVDLAGEGGKVAPLRLELGMVIMALAWQFFTKSIRPWHGEF